MYIKVFTKPSARREEVAELASGTLRISVKEPAQGNQANLRVRTIVAERLGLPVGKVRLLTGHRSRSKMLSID